MTLDVHDDMSSLFSFDLDDFHPPPQPSPPSSDRLPTIEEHNPSKQTANKQQQQQQLHQQPQHNQQFNYTLIQDSYGQISVKFLSKPQSQSQLLLDLNSHNLAQTHLNTHLQSNFTNCFSVL